MIKIYEILKVIREELLSVTCRLLIWYKQIATSGQAGTEVTRGRHWPGGEATAKGEEATDLARIDEADFVWIEGRAGDLINRGGNKVFPGEVEEVLRSVAGVDDVAGAREKVAIFVE